MFLENQVRIFLSHLVLAVLILASSITPSLAEQRKLTFCGDVAGWPPYTYELNGEVYGYDIDILEKILAPQEIDFKVYMLPWKRCLKLVEEGRMDVVLSASGTQERENSYRVTTKYYSVDPHFFYLGSRFPYGLKKPAREITDQYTVCGMRGYDYSNLGLDSEKIIRTSNNFEQLIKKTEARRCDLFVARLEILLGFEKMGVLKLPHSLQHNHVPGAEPDHFHMLVSRAIPDSEDVYRVINTGLQSLKDSGALEELVGKHEKERR